MKGAHLAVCLSVIMLLTLVTQPAIAGYELKWQLSSIYTAAFHSSYLTSDTDGNIQRQQAYGNLDGVGGPDILVSYGANGNFSVTDLATGVTTGPVLTTGQSAEDARNVRILYLDVDNDGLDEAIISIIGWGVVCLEWNGASSMQDSGPDSPGSSLRQNAPNPFNPQTTMSFSLVSASDVELVIFDVAGRMVRHLVDARLDAGSHTLTWDGRDNSGKELASGTYFYQLAVDGKRVGTEKAVVLR